MRGLIVVSTEDADSSGPHRNRSLINVNRQRAKPESTRKVGEVRIIGGTLKRSKLPVVSRQGLRPTPDRVRETLFNWLAPVIEGARVLDLCAGTGVLGIEALSRGAAWARLNELDANLAEQIIANGKRLKIDLQMEVTRLCALQLLTTPPDAGYDIVFLDPPYSADLWEALLDRLPNWLAPQAWVYLEHPSNIAPPFGAPWRIHKQGRAGSVQFYLLAQLSPAILSGQSHAEHAF